jgi:hypothetical protein
MIDNYERLVGRLMDLETKFYELQEKYQTLINDYEKLKDIHADCARHRDELGTRYDPFTSHTGRG